MTREEARQALDALLAQFSQATGIGGLATEPNGVCVLVFEKRVHLNLLVDHTSEQLVVWSTVGTLPAPGAEAMLRRLMQANLFWQGTAGATLGLMPENDDVVLAIRRPMAGLDIQGLADLVELVLIRTEALGPMIAGGAGAPATHPAVPAARSNPAAIRG